jgi:curved DNA-binding protein CbpA
MMTLADCYRLLQVADSAGQEEVKKAYRAQAFRLHPDLNPDDPQAARKFQRLNEAYVRLSEHLAAGGKPPPGPAQPPPGPQGFRRPSPGPSAQTHSRQAGAPPSQEEVLRDILKDPFARKVFEDIYAQVRKGRPPAAPTTLRRRRTFELKWGDKRYTLDLSQGLWAGVKGWFRHQFDDVQTVGLPVNLLLPGRTVRIGVAQGLSGTPRTIEVKLPLDFVVGRPIRLKGLGRKLGPLKGDLYLRILAK